MRSSRFTAVLFTVVGLAVLAVLEMVTAPDAHACSPEEEFRLELEVLQAMTPENLDDPAGPLAVALRDDDRSEEPVTPPSFESIRRIRTVIEADSDTLGISNGRITVVEAYWGVAPDLEPRVWGLQDKECTFEPAAPIARTSWLIDTQPGANIRIWSSPTEEQSYEEELTRLFGEPVRPERDADAERAALEELRERADEWLGSRLGRTVRVDLDPSKELAVDDRIVVVDDSPPLALVLGGSVALLVAAGVAVIRVTRAAATD
ncbi:MAG: hypothetical protein AAF567_03630 [Actinomycetota bacterium]